MPTCPACRADIAQGARFCPACGTATLAAAGPAADPWIGQVVNKKFRIEVLLGEGGMGRVYRATHLTLDRPVVLKMLHRGLTADPAVAERFRREAKAASRLVHPHSIQVLDFGEAEDGTLFMAMEYLSGKDLAAILAQSGPLPEERIVRIGAQILEALGEAHAHGVIHRDLKPENVMVEDRRNEPDHVTVLDFGIAKISDPGPGEGKLTQAGLVCGTPQYMSPEQARGLELDPRSDLYAMGIILYQMATGSLPFESDTPVGFLTKHIAEPPAPMRQRLPGLAISSRLEALVARALSKDPAGRPASADAMRLELLACTRTKASIPAPAAPGPAPAAPAARKASLVVPLALVLLLGGAGAAGWVWVKGQGSTAPAQGPLTPSYAGPEGERSRGAPTPGVTQPATPAPAPTAAATPVATPTPTPTQGPLTPSPSTPGAERPPLGASYASPEGERSRGAPAAEPRRDPARARSLFEKAEARRRSMDTEAAIALYLEAERADPGMAEIHKKLGQCYQLAGDIPRARERYKRYLATAPPDADRIRASLDMLR